MQTQAMRVYQITFTGRDAKALFRCLPRETMTGKGAIKAFIERYKPVQGWAILEDITDNVKKEAKSREQSAG